MSLKNIHTWCNFIQYNTFNPNLLFKIHNQVLLRIHSRRLSKREHTRIIFYSQKSLKVRRQAVVGVDMNDHAVYSLSWLNCLNISYFSSFPVVGSSSSSLAQNPSSWPLACLYCVVSHTVHRNYRSEILRYLWPFAIRRWCLCRSLYTECVDQDADS